MATPTADISTFTPEQQEAFKRAASLGSGVNVVNQGQSQVVSQARPYTPEALGGDATAYNVPPFTAAPTTDTTDLDKLISQYTSGTQEQTSLSTERSAISDSIKETLARLVGEEGKKAELETAAGIPDLSKTLNELVNQIRQTNVGAFEASQTQEDRLAPTFAILGTQARIERQRAVKNFGLAAAAEAVQGNIALANDNVQRALDAEFRPLEEVLEYQKFLYESNKDDLERADKQAADRLNILLAERTRILENQKAEKSAVQNIMLAAAQSGAPSNVLQKISEATPEQAIALATQYLGADFKRQAEQIAFDNGIKTREMQMKELEFKLNRRVALAQLAASGDASAIAELGYDPRDKQLTVEEIAKLEGTQATFGRDLTTISNALLNDSGLQSSSGLVRGGVIGGLFEGGASPLGVLSYATGYTSSKRQDFIADAGYIIKNLTFNKIKELSDQGVKLTPISEKELKAMGDASNVLVSAARFDDSGNLTGFELSEDKVREQLGLIQTHYQNAIADINTQLYLTPSEMKEITSIK